MSRKPTRPASSRTSPALVSSASGCGTGPGCRACAATTAPRRRARSARQHGLMPLGWCSSSGVEAGPEGPKISAETELTAVASRARSLTVTSTMPPNPAGRALTCKSSTARVLRRSSVTSRHGPITAGPEAKPGARPSNMVRWWRSPLTAIRVRHRARGGLDMAMAGPSARHRIATSAPSFIRGPNTISWLANIDSLVNKRSPSTKTSASVAMPPNRSTTSSPAAAGGPLSLDRNHQSSESRSRGTTAPRAASRSAPATVPGTRAGSQLAWSSSPGWDALPGAAAATLHSFTDAIAYRSVNGSIELLLRLGPAGRKLGARSLRVENAPSRELERERLAVARDSTKCCGGGSAPRGKQPVEIRRCDLGTCTRHPDSREGVGMETGPSAFNEGGHSAPRCSPNR